jgi:predicted Zn-dependent peptidase
MNTPDRKQGPKGKNIDTLQFTHVEPIALDYGVPFWFFPATGVGVARIYLYYKGGIAHHGNGLLQRAIHQQMLAGTASATAENIHGALENLGASADGSADLLYAQHTISARSSKLAEAFRLFLGYRNAAVFPESELDVYRSAAVSELKSRMATPRYWSYRRLMEEMVGTGHYQGQFTQEADYAGLNSNLLRESADSAWNPADLFIVVCGELNDAQLAEIKLVWQQYGASFREPGNEGKAWTHAPFAPVHVEHAVPNTNQVSIYFGKSALDIPDAAYYKVLVLNTLFGGFFGSRLMQNIREQKGLTYGIHSSLLKPGKQYQLLVSSDVKAENKSQVINEIKREMQALRENPVGLDELGKVQQYLCGNIKMGFDGIFSMAARVRELQIHGRDYSFMDKALTEIRAVTPEEIQGLAYNFLDPDSFYISSAGAV